jgi:HAD superfamily hydrolase (TIGR01509 family)
MRKGIFFDLDGTLADNLDLMFDVYEKFLAGFGHSATLLEFNLLNGPPLPQVVSLLKEKYSLDGTSEALLKTYHRLLDESYMHAQPAPGSRKILEKAKNAGRVVAIVTSNSQRRAAMWLEHNNMASFVDFIVSGDDCDGKPSPAPYKMAIDKGRCSADQCIAVEDSLQGVQSAVAAGIRTFCYRNGRNQDILLPENVRRINHFDELNELLE